jgi:hypothetical protein
VDVALPNASRSKVRRGAVRPGQGDEIGQVVALALAVDEPGADRDTPTLTKRPSHAALPVAKKAQERKFPGHFLLSACIHIKTGV